jgi:pilus assembly protein Flp/PilA
MQNFKQLMNNLISDESGQDLIEYALVASLVALGAVASMTTVATAIKGSFNSIASGLNNAI